jgi:hypothetical protein
VGAKEYLEVRPSPIAHLFLLRQTVECTSIYNLEPVAQRHRRTSARSPALRGRQGAKSSEQPAAGALANDTATVSPHAHDRTTGF